MDCTGKESKLSVERQTERERALRRLWPQPNSSTEVPTNNGHNSASRGRGGTGGSRMIKYPNRPIKYKLTNVNKGLAG